MKSPLTLAACALAALGRGAFAAVEIRGAIGGGAVEEHVVREPVHKVVVDAEDGDYRLGVPPGVTVTIDKPSGRVDALAVGGGVTELSDSADPLVIGAR